MLKLIINAIHYTEAMFTTECWVSVYVNIISSYST